MEAPQPNDRPQMVVVPTHLPVVDLKNEDSGLPTGSSSFSKENIGKYDESSLAPPKSLKIPQQHQLTW